MLDNAISSFSPRVRLGAVRLIRLLCQHLPMEAVAKNLLVLIVGLYPILEGEFISVRFECGLFILFCYHCICRHRL